MAFVNVVHILGGLGLLVLLNPKYFSEEFVRRFKWVFAITGLAIAAYHVSKYNTNPARWIYLFHALFVAPVVIALGVYPKVARSMLQLIACAMIAFHTAIIAKIL
jgi:TRAP-type uncharacterized transport system fused permease subunit